MNEELVLIGERLRSLRADKSLEDIAKVTGISKSLISKYERGLTDPGSKALVKFARHYNVSLDWLLGFTDDPTPIRIKSNLSFESKENILSYIEFIKNKEEGNER